MTRLPIESNRAITSSLDIYRHTGMKNSCKKTISFLKTDPDGPVWHQGLDSIAAIPYDESGMADRLTLVEAGVPGGIISGLDYAEGDVRCKAANALGGLCASPEAAQIVWRCS